MDPVSVSLVAAVIGAVSALIATRVNAQMARRGNLSEFVREQRREAYTQFAIEVEQAQRRADAAGPEADSAAHAPLDFGDLEIARVRIDLFGTHLAKVWAYRCSIALTALARAIQESPGDRELWVRRRAKLHEARANLLRMIRYELEVSAIEKTDRVSEEEGKQVKAELKANLERGDNDSHLIWLEDTPDTFVTSQVMSTYTRAQNAALVPPPKGPPDERV